MAKRVIAIGDIHGSVYWRDIVSMRRSGDRIVFLGDYFDRRGGPGTSFAQSEAENFEQICDYARDNEYVSLLVGNHDFQYTPWDEYGSAGINDAMYSTFRRLIMKNIDLLEMVRVHNLNGKPTIFSHAGISQTFMNFIGCDRPEEINDVWQDNPEEFRFRFTPPPGYEWEPVERHGNNIFQPPTWIRPEALIQDAAIGFDQVVGHTFNDSPQRVFPLEGGNILHIVCTLGPDNYLICQ